MDERISSAIYNPHNEYDITTVMGNQRLSDDWQRSNRALRARRDPRLSRFVFFLLVGVFTLLGLLNWLLS